uniref:Ig-like domain-containing protein n=1 Tax=Cyprinodon variegatus TaxID=28743 RepID=A0A3Q2CM14_CYPVA
TRLCAKCEQLKQPASMTVQPGQPLVISCQVSYSVNSYWTHWIRQPSGKGLDWIGRAVGSSTDYKTSLRNKFSISTDSSSNTVTLNGQNVQPEDSSCCIISYFVKVRLKLYLIMSDMCEKLWNRLKIYSNLSVVRSVSLFTMYTASSSVEQILNRPDPKYIIPNFLIHSFDAFSVNLKFFHSHENKENSLNEVCPNFWYVLYLF